LALRLQFLDKSKPLLMEHQVIGVFEVSE